MKMNFLILIANWNIHCRFHSMNCSWDCLENRKHNRQIYTERKKRLKYIQNKSNRHQAIIYTHTKSKRSVTLKPHKLIYTRLFLIRFHIIFLFINTHTAAMLSRRNFFPIDFGSNSKESFSFERHAVPSKGTQVHWISRYVAETVLLLEITTNKINVPEIMSAKCWKI